VDAQIKSAHDGGGRGAKVMEDQVAQQLQQVGSFADTILAFAVKYGV